MPKLQWPMAVFFLLLVSCASVPQSESGNLVFDATREPSSIATAYKVIEGAEAFVTSDTTILRSFEVGVRETADELMRRPSNFLSKSRAYELAKKLTDDKTGTHYEMVYYVLQKYEVSYDRVRHQYKVQPRFLLKRSNPMTAVQGRSFLKEVLSKEDKVVRLRINFLKSLS